MRMHPYRWMLAVAGMLLIGLSPFAGASAQNASATPDAFMAPEFAIFAVGEYENQWFEETIDAGTSKELIAGIRNSGSGSVSLRTYAANALNPPNGGFAAASEEDAPIGPTLWVDYAAETFALEPGEQREQPFTVTVPAGTPPGEYVVALVAQTSESLAIPGSETLRQIIRSTVSVEITVPGEMTSGLEMGHPAVTLTTAGAVLDVPVTNIGTARVRPAGMLTLADAKGKAIINEMVEMGSLYGGHTTSVRVFLPPQVPPGEYQVSLALADEATGSSDAIEDVPVTLAAPEQAEPLAFEVEAASVVPQGDPVQYAEVTATLTNNGPAIPTANITLNVQRDGEAVESYALASGKALAGGPTEFTDRYIPAGGWAPGTYIFQLVVSSASGGTETVLAPIDIEDTIVVP